MTGGRLFKQVFLAAGRYTCSPDGGNVCVGLSRVIGIKDSNPVKNIRSAGRGARAMLHAGQFLIDAMISRVRLDRAISNELAGSQEIAAVRVNTPFAKCEMRNTNGVYGNARSGELPRSTPVDSAGGTPPNREVVLPCAAGKPEIPVGLVAPYPVATEEA